MARLYDAMMKAASDKTSELYRADGSPRTGSNVRCYFWVGAGRVIHPLPPRQTLGWAAYMAGRDWAASITPAATQNITITQNVIAGCDTRRTR